MQTYTKAPICTVAWSAYNWLACQDGARTGEQIFEGTRNAWDSSLTRDACDEALIELVARGYLATPSDDTFDVKDPQRLTLIMRSREGDGWQGWRLGARPEHVSIPIEQALKGK